MPDYLLTDAEIDAVNRRVGGTRIKSLLEAQVEKVLRIKQQEAATADQKR